MGPHQPVHEIYVVEVLLDDLVAANPYEGVPVAQLPLQVAPPGFAAFGVKDRAAQIIGVQRGNVADRALLDLLHGFHILALPAPLGSGDYRELALRGQFTGRYETPRAYRIGSDGFLGEDMIIGDKRCL